MNDYCNVGGGSIVYVSVMIRVDSPLGNEDDQICHNLYTAIRDYKEQ